MLISSVKIKKQMNLNQKIKELRLSKGWTQKELAQKLDLVSASISSYEKEVTPITPSIKILYKMVELFGVPMHELIHRDLAQGEDTIGNINEGVALKKFITINGLSETQLATDAKMNRSDFYYYYDKGLIPLSGWEKLKKAGIKREKVIEFYIANYNGIDSKPIIEDKLLGIPILNVDFTAGDVTQFSEDKNLIIGYVNFDGFKKCTGFVRVTGQSMEPEFRSGDWIGLEPQIDFKIIEYGNVFGIVTKSEQRMIKVIRKGPTDDILILKSFNPDYDDITIERSDLLSVWKIHGPIRNRWQ
jgi:transcriptional regulator with XRE-family HTH domain